MTARLTPREMETLRLVATGEDNRVIATAMGISESTVRVHTNALFRKLGAASRAQLVVMAMERGLVPSPGAARYREAAKRLRTALMAARAALHHLKVNDQALYRTWRSARP